MFFMRCLTTVVLSFGMFNAFELQGMSGQSASSNSLSRVAEHKQRIVQFKKKLGGLTKTEFLCNCLPTRLHWAAALGDLAAVRRLIVDEHFPVDVQDRRGITPLYTAAEYGHVHIVQFLVDGARANYKICTSIRETALHVAVEKDQRNVVRFLVKKPGLVDMQDCDGCTALYSACDHNLEEIIGILIIEGHADVDKCFNGGFTPLHRVCDLGWTEIVRFLIKVGHACVNALNNEGATPLHFAVANGHLAIVDILLKAGANPEIKDQGNMTAYDVASNALKKLGSANDETSIRLRSALHVIINLLNQYREKMEQHAMLQIAQELESHLLGKIGHLISLPTEPQYSEVQNPIFLAIKYFPIRDMNMHDFEENVMYVIWFKNLRERFSASSHEQIYRELAEIVHEFTQKKTIIKLLKTLGLREASSTQIVPSASSSSLSSDVAHSVSAACVMNAPSCQTGKSS